MTKENFGIYIDPDISVEDLDFLSPVNRRYEAEGGAAAWLSSPVQHEHITNDDIGRRRQYEHDWIYWHPRTGAHTIKKSPIWNRYAPR